jgi:hypothetical protein
VFLPFLSPIIFMPVVVCPTASQFVDQSVCSNFLPLEAKLLVASKQHLVAPMDHLPLVVVVAVVVASLEPLIAAQAHLKT